MRNFLFLLPLFTLFSAQAQIYKPTGRPVPAPLVNILTPADQKYLALMEDTLHRLSNLFTMDTVLENRKKACYSFIPKLVQALKTPNSFYFPFDSFETISKVYPPDSTFRILTWQLYTTVPVNIPAKYSKTGRDTFFEKPYIRYYGVIQMRSRELTMFPLFDAGDTLAYGTQQVLGPNNWWGQLYYNIIQKTVKGKNYYTLFGYEAVDQLARRKIIDVLTFSEDKKPKFGAPLFYFKYTDTAAIKERDTLSRFFIEYKWNATTHLNYDPSLEMIVFDHVAPPSDKAKGATFTYVPDGTYEGFIWAADHWNWVEKVFTYAINKNDAPPIPVPLFGPTQNQTVNPGEESPH